MTHATNALREIEDLPDMGIIMPDGTRLSARVWRPVDAIENPVPAILEYLPYRKRDGTVARDALTHPYFAKRGYACIRVDIRGNGDSEGVMTDEYTSQELEDGVEVIKWLAAQPWCSGKVGMMGISWGGFNALQVAALQPEALKAIITLCSTADRYHEDIHYRGGCLLGQNFDWGAVMWSYSSRAPDPAIVGDKWRDMWLERLEAEPFLPSLWLRHQHRDAYWKHGSICEALAISGWADAYKNTVPQLVGNLSVPVKGINGPWMHKYPHIGAPEPRIGFLQEALRWWDRWLKDIDTGVEDDPDYRMYLMDGVRPQTWYGERHGRWIAEPEWPTRRAPETLHFAPGAKLGKPAGDLHAIIASPQHCGEMAGEFCAIWGGPEMPGDQRADDAYSAVFCGDALEHDTDLAGAPVVHLTLASDQPQAQIAVRLNHIHADGRITYGLLNLSHRDSHSEPTPLTPDVPVQVSVTLDHIAYRVPRGDWIAVAISSAYWPMMWPSPQNTVLTLTSGRVDLPVRPTAQGDEAVFPPPETEAEWPHQILRPPQNKRYSETDMTTGNVVDDFGRTRDLAHGLITDTVATKRWTIHPDDSNAATVWTEWDDEIERDGLKLHTKTSSKMWSDKTHFHLRARLIAYENGKVVYERDISDRIKRDQV